MSPQKISSSSGRPASGPVRGGGALGLIAKVWGTRCAEAGPGLSERRHLQVALRQQAAAFRGRNDAVDDLDRCARERDLRDETVMCSRERLPDRRAVDDVAGVVDVEITAEISPLGVAGRDGDGLVVRAGARASAGLELGIVGIAEVGLLAGREEGNRVIVGRCLRPDRVASAVGLARIGGNRIPAGVGRLGSPQAEEHLDVRRARRPRDALQAHPGNGEAVVVVAAPLTVVNGVTEESASSWPSCCGITPLAGANGSVDPSLA